jgi:hypothetical protein
MPDIFSLDRTVSRESFPHDDDDDDDDDEQQ